MGWLKRHLNINHGLSDTTIPVSRSPPKEKPVAKAKAKPSGGTGLTCAVCGAGARPGRQWGEKTLANHMAKEHRVNAKTGLVSRTRKGKGVKPSPCFDNEAQVGTVERDSLQLSPTSRDHMGENITTEQKRKCSFVNPSKMDCRRPRLGVT